MTRTSIGISIIVSVIGTALIVGGGTFWWMHQKMDKLTDEIVTLQNQMTRPKEVTNDYYDDLIEAKFNLAILRFWQVDQIFRDPENKGRFYYITNDANGFHILVYDLAKDTNYKQDGYFNIPAGNTFLLTQKLDQSQELVGVGVIDGKFVFGEKGKEKDSGPCPSAWLYTSNLAYIDLGVSNPTRKPFTLPEELKNSEEQKVAACEEAVGNI